MSSRNTNLLGIARKADNAQAKADYWQKRADELTSEFRTLVAERIAYLRDRIRR